MKISVKKIALASPLIFIGLPALLFSIVVGALAYSGWGATPLTDSSEAKIGELTIRLDRYAPHPYLAEYKRTLTVTDPRGDVGSYDLPTDSGGAERITVCEIADGDFLLVDRFDAYILTRVGKLNEIPGAVDAEEQPDGSLEPVLRQGATPDCLRPTGRFDRGFDNRYGFQPATS